MSSPERGHSDDPYEKPAADRRGDLRGISVSPRVYQRYPVQAAGRDPSPDPVLLTGRAGFYGQAPHAETLWNVRGMGQLLRRRISWGGTRGKADYRCLQLRRNGSDPPIRQCEPVQFPLRQLQNLLLCGGHPDPGLAGQTYPSLRAAHFPRLPLIFGRIQHTGGCKLNNAE